MIEIDWGNIRKMFSEKFKKVAALIFVILAFSFFSFIIRMFEEGWSWANFLIIILTLLCLYLINENNKLYEKIEKRINNEKRRRYLKIRSDWIKKYKNAKTEEGKKSIEKQWVEFRDQYFLKNDIKIENHDQSTIFVPSSFISK